MKLCDTNSDGHVEEAEYEYFVVRALERSGVQVNAWKKESLKYHKTQVHLFGLLGL